MMTETTQIPASWERVLLNQISVSRMGKTILAKELGAKGIPVYSANAGNEEWGYIESSEVTFGKNTLVISARGNIGAPKKPRHSIFVSTQTTIATTFFELDVVEFYFYFLTAYNFGKHSSQTTIPMLRVSDVNKIEVPVPPLNEQHRIVAKIEELFSELDKGIENLKTARAQLKMYRQALLKHAFEGKLTAQWRVPNRDKLETANALQKRIQQERAQRYLQQLADGEAAGGSKPKVPKSLPPLTSEELAKLPELPEGWVWVLIDVLLSLEKKPMATGPFGTLLSKSDHKSSGIPVLGIENIGNGKFVAGNKIFVSEQKAEELESFKVESGDIVISRSGTVGEICKIPDGLGKAFISTNLIRVSLNTNVINQDYFVYLFQGGGSVKQQVKHLCKGSSREFLNQTILSAISFPLPSIEEQRQIVDAIDARFSIADQLELTITTSLQQAESLRQSILKEAFSGQLVPQDPHDESAAALLARIRAVREQAATPKRKGKSL